MKNFALIMGCICVLLLITRLYTTDYSNFLILENIFNLLLPIGLLFLFISRYLKEKTNKNNYD